jgi:hypothetical protein
MGLRVRDRSADIGLGGGRRSSRFIVDKAIASGPKFATNEAAGEFGAWE